MASPSPRCAALLSVLALCLAAGCALSREASEAPAAAAVAEQHGALAQAAPAATQRQLIRTVTLELEVESVGAARRQIEALVQGAGGFIEALEGSHFGSGQRVELTLRIPTAALEATLARVRKLGRAARESQSVEDVTRKYVDADARLRNLQRTEQRLLALLENQSSALADVLAVERELTRVREEIEVLDAELRALKEQVALATLKLSLLQEADAEPPPSVWNPWRRLWRNAGGILAESLGALLGAGAALLTAVLYLLPWSPLLVLGWFLLRRFRRPRG